MLERARAAGLPFAWITADSVYRADSALRRWLQAQGLGYVPAVTKAQRGGLPEPDRRVGPVRHGTLLARAVRLRTETALGRGQDPTS